MKDVRYTQVLSDPMQKIPFKIRGMDYTLQHLLYECASTPIKGDEDMAIGEKMQLSAIARKVADMKQLKAADLVKLKERGGRFLSVLACGFLVDEINHALEETSEVAE